jgi:hypothetical protein
MAELHRSFTEINHAEEPAADGMPDLVGAELGRPAGAEALVEALVEAEGAPAEGDDPPEVCEDVPRGLHAAVRAAIPAAVSAIVIRTVGTVHPGRRRLLVSESSAGAGARLKDPVLGRECVK